MRIDAHQHFWRYTPERFPWIGDRLSILRRDFLPADLAPLLDASAFTSCIAVQASQDLEDTETLLAFAEAHAFIAGVVGWVDLQAPTVREQLATYAPHPKLVGIRHIVHDEPDDRFLLCPAFCDGIARLEEFGLTYDILIFPRHFAVAAEFVARFPRQPFVLDHLGKPEIRNAEVRNWERGLRALAAFPNVCAKLSGLVTEASWPDWTADQMRVYLDIAFDAFGADRLMIGSDWPVCTLAGDYARTMRVVIDYLDGRTPVEQSAVLGGTAQRLWALPRPMAGQGDRT